MKGPRTSIAMATYNGAHFIEQQLQSFAEQTWLPDELVITDDGSADELAPLPGPLLRLRAALHPAKSEFLTLTAAKPR